MLLLMLPLLAGAQGYYPTYSKTLANGLKVIVCEKPGNDFVESEVWYRTGSKDEAPGIRGMAHLFEHMMFRGTEKHPGNAVFETVDKVGGSCNAYTTFDRTVYHEYIPASALEAIFDLEADRMSNLVVTQEILNTEREVVGEELRIGKNNWYQNVNSDRYSLLYPAGHPYEVDVIGYLNEITSFTSKQCMDFYNNYYSPNNAFLVVVGNVKSQDVFALADQYFGKVTKQLDIKPKSNVPDVFTSKVKQQELSLNFPVQIYSFVFGRPAANDKDFIPLAMLTDLLFTDENSVLNNRLVKKEYTAFGLLSASDDYSIYPNLGVVDVVMQASPGNVKVKKAVKEEIVKAMSEGIPKEMIDSYVKAMQAEELLGNYSSAEIAGRLGMAEYYFKDHNKAYSLTEEYKKVTNDDLKRVAAKYLSEDKLQMINIRPE
jgi:zinc protease